MPKVRDLGTIDVVEAMAPSEYKSKVKWELKNSGRKSQFMANALGPLMGLTGEKASHGQEAET